MKIKDLKPVKRGNLIVYIKESKLPTAKEFYYSVRAALQHI